MGASVRDMHVRSLPERISTRLVPWDLAVSLQYSAFTMFICRSTIVALGMVIALPVGNTLGQVLPDTVRVTLRSVLQRTLAVSPELGEARAGQAFAEARHSLARASRYLTEFSGSSVFSAVPGIDNPNGAARDALYLDPAVRNDFDNLAPFGQAEVTLLQPLATWGQLGGSIRAAGHGVEVEAAAIRTRELAAALRVADLYYAVLLADDLYRLTDRAGDVVRRAMGEVDRLLAEGDPGVDDADRYEVLMTEQEFNMRAREVAERRQTAYAALRRQLREEGHIVPEISGLQALPFVPEALDTYFEMALRFRPEVAQAQAGLAARDALVRVARSDYYPQFVFGISASVGYASNRTRQPTPFVSDAFRRSSVRTGFGFQQKLNFSQTRARVAQAEAEREKVRHQMEGARQLVLLEVEKAYRDVLVAQTALVAQDSSFAISKQWLRVEYINFDLDLGDTENLIKAVRANLDQEARYYEAVWRYNSAVLRLLFHAGILVDSIENGTLLE